MDCQYGWHSAPVRPMRRFVFALFDEPIVDVAAGEVAASEALIMSHRGCNVRTPRVGHC
jgi:hypothetical protein